MAATHHRQARHALIVAFCATLLLCLPAAPASAVPRRCAGQAATLVGTAGRDNLIGTAGRDVIVGGAGDDAIEGLGGDDLICAGKGRDRVFGDWHPGNQPRKGGGGDDVLYLGWGHDRGDGGPGNDRVSGMYGRDVLRGDPLWCAHYAETQTCGVGDDHLLGGAKDDVLAADPGNDVLSQGPTLSDRSGLTVLRAGGSVRVDLRAGTLSSPYTGNDTLRGWHNIASEIYISDSAANVIHLDDGATMLWSSSSGGDTIYGYGGNDGITLPYGRGSVVYAGAGDDRVEGSNGDDSLYGQSGNDLLRGMDGTDLMHGGKGAHDECITEPEDIVIACERQSPDPGGSDDRFYDPFKN